MSTEYNFRTAFVNGFNRKDVIAYIEGLQKELINANAGREKLQADYMTARKAAENYYANLNAALAHIKTLEAQIAQFNRDAASRPSVPNVPAAPPPAVPEEKDPEETVVIDENTLMLQNIEEKIEALLQNVGSNSDTAAQTARQIAGGYAQQTQTLLGATAESLAGLRSELGVLSGKINDKLNALADKIDELSSLAAVKPESPAQAVIQSTRAEETSGSGFVSSLENYASSNPGEEAAAGTDECDVEVEPEAARTDFIINPTVAETARSDNGIASPSMPAEPPRPFEPANGCAADAPEEATAEPAGAQPATQPSSGESEQWSAQQAMETQLDAFEFDEGDSATPAQASAQRDDARMLDLFGKSSIPAPDAGGTEFSALLSDNTLAAVPDENKQLTPEEIEKLMEMFPDDGETASD